MQHTYYKKIGRKYVPIQTHEIEGYGEGLYLIIRNKHSKETLSCFHVHELQNASKFADLYKANKESVTGAIMKAMDSISGPFSASQLADRIIVELTKCKD